MCMACYYNYNYACIIIIATIIIIIAGIFGHEKICRFGESIIGACMKIVKSIIASFESLPAI